MKFNDFTKKFLLFLKLCAFGLITGVSGGFVGAAFAALLSFVTKLRESAPWLILLLPLGGVITVFLYRISALEKHRGTNEIILNLRNGSKIRSVAAPLIFISTAITHLFGGSAGREGAALQLGGAGSSAISDLLKLKGTQRTVFVMSGMSAVFASVFGTPLTAAFFVLEFRSDKRTFFSAIFPCFISSIVAKMCASFSGVETESFQLSGTMPFSLVSVGKIMVLAVGLALLSMAMCFIFENAKHWAEKIIFNSVIRTLVFSVIVIVLTACIGDMRYNGSGMNMAIKAVAGDSDWYDFILKIVFTAITLAAGFKGGELVPAFCVGATFGCFFGGLLGIDSGLAAALGLVGLFCCATSSPVSAVFLGIELFGVSAVPYMIIICMVMWLLSTPKGLFENRFFTSPIFKKSISKN